MVTGALWPWKGYNIGVNLKQYPIQHYLCIFTLNTVSTTKDILEHVTPFFCTNYNNQDILETPPVKSRGVYYCISARTYKYIALYCILLQIYSYIQHSYSLMQAWIVYRIRGTCADYIYIYTIVIYCVHSLQQRHSHCSSNISGQFKPLVLQLLLICMLYIALFLWKITSPYTVQAYDLLMTGYQQWQM